MQNAQVPSSSSAEVPTNQTSNTDGWYSHFPSQPSTNNAPRANETVSQQPNLPKDPVFTMPISVKPKTREPTSFTDNRIYVSNIPFSFREQDLAAMFYRYGRVLSVEIVTNDRGSKGFGFVTLDSIESCERARVALHESHVQGRIIEVRRATPSRRKVPNLQQTEVLPPPKLCVDLRAPHSLWRSENTDNLNQLAAFANSNFSLMMPPFGSTGPSRFFNDNVGSPFTYNRPNFGAIGEANSHRQHYQPPKCIKHSDLKLSSNGDYFCKNGEPTTETSLLMCINGQNECRSEIESVKNDTTDCELTQVFPNHIRDQITALLDTSTQHSSSNNFSNHSSRRADSVGSSEVRTTSESETASDDEQPLWTPNTSPDLLASLYEGSTSFHAQTN